MSVCTCALWGKTKRILWKPAAMLQSHASLHMVGYNFTIHKLRLLAQAVQRANATFCCFNNCKMLNVHVVAISHPSTNSTVSSFCLSCSFWKQKSSFQVYTASRKWKMKDKMSTTLCCSNFQDGAICSACVSKPLPFFHLLSAILLLPTEVLEGYLQQSTSNQAVLFKHWKDFDIQGQN